MKPEILEAAIQELDDIQPFKKALVLESGIGIPYDQITVANECAYFSSEDTCMAVIDCRSITGVSALDVIPSKYI